MIPATFRNPPRWVAAALILAGVVPAAAQEAAPEEGLFLTVQAPLTSKVVEHVKATATRARDRGVKKIVFDFNPDRHPAAGRDYGSCRELAAFLLRLQDVTTVAFVHNDVGGHLVLPVLACKELVMAREAKIGRVQGEAREALQKDQIQFYETVAEARGRAAALILKMADRDLEVVEGTRGGGVWYADKARLTEEAKKGFVVTRPAPLLPAGAEGWYGAAEAQKFGLCNLVKESRQAVAEAYQMPATSLREDPLQGRTPVARRVEVRGVLNKALQETVQRRVRRLVAQKANFILVELHSSGGDPSVGLDLARFFRELTDDAGKFPVMTVAYIPERAPDAATIVALGCSEVVVGKKAEVGDFENIVYEKQGENRVEADPARYKLLREALEGLAQEQGYSPLVARGMLDKDLVLYQVQARKGASAWAVVTGEELKQDEAGEGKWGKKILRKESGRFLKLDAGQARELGLARHVADDLAQVYSTYGLEDVPNSTPDWLEELATFLRHPLVSVFLVMIGITCLILELKMPGVGLPGVVAALCFVLYFWAHSQLAGQITMLAVLLFVLGLILIGIEVFVLPGFGVTGISGVLLVLLSLALVTLEKKPETTQEWLSLGRTIGQFGMGLLAAVALAFSLARYLPHIPYANRLVLRPPQAGAAAEDEGAAAGVNPELAALLGAFGTAATTLRPAGLARFGEQYLDVVTDGSFIPDGARVQVIEIEGNRIVVQEV